MLYDSKYYLQILRNIKKFNNLSFKSKFYFRADVLGDLNKFSRVKAQKTKHQENKREKKNAYDTASELYNDLLKIGKMR